MRADRAQIISWIVWWALLCGAALLFFSDRTIHSDEGNVLNMAWQLGNGRQIYTGFSEFVTPGSGYMLHWLWELFDHTSYTLARVSSIVFWFVSALGLGWFVWKHTRAFLPVATASVGWMILTLFHPLINYNAHSSFVAIGMLVLYWWALQRRAAWQFVLVGVLMALLFLFLQTKGVFVVAAVIVFHVWNKQHPVASMNIVQLPFARRVREAAIMLWTATGFVGLIGLYWGSAAFYSWFVLPFRLSYLQHSIHETGAAILQLSIVFCMCTATALYWWLSSNKSKVIHVQVLILSTVVQAAVFASSFNLIDLAHTAINAFPFVLFVACLGWWCLSIRTIHSTVRDIIYIVALSFGLLAVIATTRQVITGVNIYSPNQQVELFPELFESQQITDAQYIYAGPFLPGFYYELGKDNIFTDASNMTLCDADCEQRAIRKLQEAPVEIALVDYVISDKFGYSPERALDVYIREHYELCGAIRGRIRVYALNGCTERY